MATAVQRWQASDGQEYKSEAEANAHDDYLALVKYFPPNLGNPKLVYETLTKLLREKRIQRVKGA